MAYKRKTLLFMARLVEGVHVYLRGAHAFGIKGVVLALGLGWVESEHPPPPSDAFF